MEAPQISNFSSKDFGSRIESSLRHLQKEKLFCDVTITCEGRKIDAHKVVLARGSRLFNKIIKLNPLSHPIIYLCDVKLSYLLNILDFMYQGEVSIDKWEHNNFLAVARDLEVNDLTEEAFKDSKHSIENKSKKQRLGNSPKQQFNLDYKIKTDNKLDDSHIVVNDLKTIDKLEDFEQFADEDFEDFKDSKQSIEDIDGKNKNQQLDNKCDNSHTAVNDKSEGITLKKNLIDGSHRQDLNVEYKIEIRESHDLKDDDFKDSKRSIEVIEDKNKKRRLDSTTKQQIKLDYRIKTDDVLGDSDTVVNDLKIDKLEDFEQIADKDFEDFKDSKQSIEDKNKNQRLDNKCDNSHTVVNDKSEGITLKKNRIDSSPRQDLKIEITESHDLKGDDFKDSKRSIEVIEDKNKKRRLDSSTKQQIKLDYRIKTDVLGDSDTVINDLKIDKLEDFEQFADEDFVDVNVEYKIKIEMENKNSGKNENIISTQGTGKGQSNSRVQRLQIRDIAKLSGNENSSECNDSKTCVKCEQCNETYSSTDKLKYPCSHCDFKATTKEDVKKHVLSIHEGIQYPRSLCDYKTITKADMKKHVLSIHERKRYPCSHCDYKATTTSHLKAHVLSKHEGMRYPCAHCDYKATTKGDLKKHALNKHEGKQYPCSHCDYKATTTSSLKEHVLSIHEGMRYPCSQCDYKTALTSNLKRHVLSIHEGMRYPCAQCDHKATTKGDMKKHVLNKHKGKRYPCSHCDYKATAPSRLKSHVLSIHEGMQCDYKANQKSTLKTHINKYHKFVKE